MHNNEVLHRPRRLMHNNIVLHRQRRLMHYNIGCLIENEAYPITLTTTVSQVMINYRECRPVRLNLAQSLQLGKAFSVAFLTLYQCLDIPVKHFTLHRHLRCITLANPFFAGR
jgi:hypothetical protein